MPYSRVNDWDVVPRRPGLPELHFDGFDGPLDLLLDLVERRRIDLSRIPVAELAEQCAAALQRIAGTVPIDRRMEWLILASRLLLLRSRLLDRPARGSTRRRRTRRGKRSSGSRHAAFWAPRRTGCRAARDSATTSSPGGGTALIGRPPPNELMTACLTLLRDATRIRRRAAYVPIRQARSACRRPWRGCAPGWPGSPSRQPSGASCRRCPEPAANRDRLARSAVATTLLRRARNHPH